MTQAAADHSETRESLAWPSALALALAMLLATFPQFLFGAVAPQLRVDLGIGPEVLGLLFATFSGLTVLGSPLAGRLTDRLGGRRSSLGVLILSGAGLGLASVAGSPAALFVAVVPAGIAMSFATPATNLWAAAGSQARQSTLVSSAQAGVQAAALLAGALAAANALGLNWRGAFRVTLVLAIIGVGIVTSTRSGPAVAPPGAGRRRQPDMTGYPWPLMGYALPMGLGTSAVMAFLPSFGVDEVGLSAAQAGATTAVWGLLALAVRIVLGSLLRRSEASWWILAAIASGAAVAIIIMSMGVIHPVWLWVGVVAFGTLGPGWAVVAMLQVVRQSAAPGRATGWIVSSFYTGLWIGPPLAGQLIVRVGYWPVWLSAATCFMVAVLPVAVSRSRVGQRPEREHPTD